MMKFRVNYFKRPQFVGFFDYDEDDEDNDEDEDCIICFQKLKVNVEILKCNHKFHINCVNSWKHIHRHCPTCRRVLPKQ
jgi:hypothetical protein